MVYVDQLIAGDKNHPSVIMWPVANGPTAADPLLAHLGYTEPEAGAAGEELDEHHQQLGKAIVLTEWGTDALVEYHSVVPQMWTEAYQVEFLRRSLEVAAKRPFVAGIHVWNVADFKTAQTILRAVGMNLKGVFTQRQSTPNI